MLRERLGKEWQELKRAHQLRALSLAQGHDFSANDYLALAKHPAIVDAAKKSLDSYGYGATSSRYIRGESPLYRTLEERLADFKQCEKALLFPSGYAANVGLLSCLIGPGDLVFSDRLNHASIIDGLRLSRADIVIFEHLDVDDLRRKIASAPKDCVKFLVTESLFSMDGDIAPLDRYQELARKDGLFLIVDEAHAVGLYGPKGRGLVNHFGIEKELLVSINGLGKAFGCYGAFIAGDLWVMDYIEQKARTLMFSTALPPSALAAIGASLDLVESGDELRRRLFDNVGSLAHGLELPALSPIFPLMIGDNEKALTIAFRLAQEGFDIRAIRPPTVPKGQARLRLTTNVSQEKALLDDFLRALKKWL